MDDAPVIEGGALRTSVTCGFLGSLGLFFLCPLLAQVPPNAGQIQEQLRVPLPTPAGKPSEIRIAPPAAEKKADSMPFFVAGFRVSGVTAFSEQQLLEVLGLAGRDLTLAQVQQRADRLTKFYKDSGYVVARALVPAQEVRDGIVEIHVLEGRYGLIDIRNATDVSEHRIRDLLGEIKEGALIFGPALEKRVLLVSDLAGIHPKATLETGQATGMSDLVLEIGTGQAKEYSLSADNAGNRFTGKNRINGAFVLNSPAGIGDRLTASAITSGKGLLSMRFAYELPAGSSGLRAGPYISRTTYLLGDAFRSLDAHGTADAFGASFVFPLIRSTALNVRATATGEMRRLEDVVGATSSVNSKRAEIIQVGIGGDARDGFLAGALTAFQGTLTSGKLELDTPTVAATDAAGPLTQGGYGKVVVNVYRLQGLSESWRLGASYTGQWASKNLDASEKFSVGGLTGVRAYPLGEAAGDDVQLLQLELRHQGGALGPGQISPFGFFDAAHSRIFHNSFATSGVTNVRKLAGHGVGAEWSAPGVGYFRCWLAVKGTSDPATSDTDRKARLWLQAGLAL
jgi:hemolysin activation/secretion protein